LFQKAEIDPSRVGLCVAGTETAVDHSKPVAAYLHRLLGLPERCRVFEAKHACFGGTAGLLAAVDWIASGSARGRAALVVCTDVARYALGSAGEPTQGAGAVAMLISENPRLLDSKDAVVDGHHSVQCYLDALAGAYSAFLDAARETGTDTNLARRCYHVPYGKMAKKAHRHLMQLEGKSEAEADASYAAEVASSLKLPGQVGNIYTGSLYLALASLLHAEAGALEGQRVGLFSYGSGCTAEYFAGRVVEGAGAFAAQLALAEPLDGRRRYSVAEYEAIRNGDGEVDRRPVEAANFTPGAVAFLGVDNERRVYQA
jgi:hydroxymethylglutaryl-CoA synthase